jgi:hypothetical protein
MPADRGFWYELDNRLANQRQLLEKIMIDLTKLTADVAAQTTVVASAVTLLQNLSAEIAALAAASTDPATQAALLTLQGELEANTATLSDAVAANTPSDVTPAP